MIKIKTNANYFKSILGTLYRIPYNATLIVYKSFFFEVTEKQLIISVIDDQTGIEIKKILDESDNLKIEGSGKIMISAYGFNELIQKFDNEITINQIEKTIIKITSGKSQYQIPLFDEVGWVDTRINKKENSITLKAKEVSQIYSQVAFISQSKDAELVFQGVNFSFKDKELNIAATDGARIAYKRIVLNQTGTGVHLIPSRVFLEISRTLNNKEEKFNTVKIYFNEDDVFFEFLNKLTISVLKIKEKFPNIETQLELHKETMIECNKQELIKATERISVMFEKKSIPSVRLLFQDGVFSAESPENKQVGFSREEIKVISTSGIKQKTNIKSDFLLKGLMCFDEENIQLFFTINNGPIWIQATNNDSSIHLIMPFWNL